MRTKFSLAALTVLVWSAQIRADEPTFTVVGYLPEYRIANVDLERLAPITDLVFFGLEPPADGRLADAPIKPAVLKKLQQIKRTHKCRLLISIGGWDRSEGFRLLAKTEAARQRYISSLLAYCRNNQFDGVDYDWEHPQGAEELADYVQLLCDTKAAFRDAGLLVTVAQASWQNLGPRAYAAVDRVHLMSYDHAFPQATFDKSNADVDRLIGWGCPPAKITMGLPFYGRNQKREARTYRDLAKDHTLDPNTDILDGFAFNGRATIKRKVNFAMEQKLSGVMIWELGQDAAQNDESLLRAINQQIRNSKSKKQISE